MLIALPVDPFAEPLTPVRLMATAADATSTGITPIAGLLLLRELDFDSTQISDLSLVAELKQLQRLDCSSTQVNDLSAIASSAMKSGSYARSAPSCSYSSRMSNPRAFGSHARTCSDQSSARATS
jgi:hypothetical protein